MNTAEKTTATNRNRYAIVTGGSRGLGFETAIGLLKAGISVVIIGKDPERAKNAAAKLNEIANSVTNNSNNSEPDQKLFDKFLEKVKEIEELRTYEDKENFNEHSGNHWYVDKGYKHFWLFVSL
ncbi:MAG: SDR family NAD(P)-dependent oxidoreductase, partial [Actinobacteria bacterium]|nr:SDR family NAD(P)-dependent oxidoreductase [Actinomycetota bacterium]